MKVVYTCLLTIATCLFILSTSLVQASSFPTLCEQTPTRLSSTAVTGTSAQLTWVPIRDSVQFEIQWRALTGADSCANNVNSSAPWITVSNLRGSQYNLTGLSPNTCYQWRIRIFCQTSKFSDIMLFSTNPCNPVVIRQAIGSGGFIVLGGSPGWDIGARGDGPIHYQWYKDGTAPENKLVGQSGVFTSQSTAITLPNVQFSDAGIYACLISNGCSSGFTNDFYIRVVSCSASYSEGTKTLRDGSWNDPGIWSCGVVPYRFDPVQVHHSVTVPANYTGYAGSLGYSTGGKLIIPATSKIELGSVQAF